MRTGNRSKTSRIRKARAPTYMDIVRRKLLPCRELHRIREPCSGDDVSIEGGNTYLKVHNAR